MSAYPFQRLLLATEHTEFDAGAERVAFAMAQRCGVPLRVVVPIVSNPEYEVAAPELALRDERKAAEKIAALRSIAQQMGVQLDIHVRRGAETYQEIVAEAAASQTDLIIIRRRGNPGFLANLLVGEMVSKVIRDASCCVLMVPRAAHFWQHEILAAVSDTPNAQKITSIAASIASACALPLTLVSIAENQAKQAEAEILNQRNVALASGQTSKVRGRVLVGKPVAQVLATARDISADLLVIGRQRYNLIPFALGRTSIMQQIAGALDVPTLVVPAR